jgi:NAD(P)-dependent dehydrogenase (short-subunit alcohol dehydrogenase family)
MATAARLAAGGDLVLMGTRRLDICERFAAQLRADGAAAFAAHLDLDAAPSINQFVESANYLIGAVDVLVTNAGMADGSWVGAQHLAAQLIPPMIDNGHGDVVLISPALLGASATTADPMLDAWAAGLDAEFVGTGVRASIVRAAGPVRPDDVGRLIAALLNEHLRVVEIMAPEPAGSGLMPVQEIK